VTDAVRARVLAAALSILAVTASLARAQTPQTGPTVQLPPAPTALDAQRVDESATLEFFNRTITVFHARVFGRSPEERALAAHRQLEALAEERIVEPVEAHAYPAGTVISVASRGVFVLAVADADALSGETLDSLSAQAVLHLRIALSEAAEARRPGVLARSAVLATLVVVLAYVALLLLGRLRRRLAASFAAFAEQKFVKQGSVAHETLQASRTLELPRYIVSGAVGVVDLLVVYGVTSFVLRLFPYTRPWGESMRHFIVTTAEMLVLSAAQAVPGLFVVAIVVVVTRIVTRTVAAWLRAVEEGRAEGVWIHPETAQPTRRLATAILWTFAAVVAYPYLPGSGSEAFKGASVFLGLLVTFGSSGLVNQFMSGFVIMYSRSVRVCDFVKIGDVEGTVEKLGVLSTKIKTPWSEDVTIPNAVVVGQTTIDYSRTGDTTGLYTPTAVTIGYDAPWRQVHALLLHAAERTPGLRAEPKPMVLQSGLEDFYVRYTLLVALDRQSARPFTLAALHANIQDAFNEAGVQIMSPNYVLDPKAPKVVPKERWFPAPPAGV